MSDKIDASEWESVRNENIKELVVVDISGIEDSKPFIKAMAPWAEKFRKNYDKISLKCVDDQETERNLLILEGVRKETEEEFRERMGIKDDNSWSVQYQNLTKCTKEEAKSEMVKMFINGSPLTPEEWIDYKKEQVKTFLNV